MTLFSTAITQNIHLHQSQTLVSYFSCTVKTDSFIITGLSAVDIEDPGNVDKLDLSTGSYGSFKPPQRMIAMAQETGIKKCKYFLKEYI